MMNRDWHNANRVSDVNNDMITTPLDALLVINRLNSSGKLTSSRPID